MNNTRTSNQASLPARIWKPVIIGLLAIVAAYGLATLILGRMVAAEIARIKAGGDCVSCTELGGPQIPASENGALDMEKALGIVAAMPENMRNFESQSLSPEESAKNPAIWYEVGQELGHYSEVFALVESASTKPKYRYTVDWSKGANTPLPHYGRMRSLTRLFAADAKVKAYFGDKPGAVRSVELAIDVNQSLKDEPTLIGMLVRASMLAITCRSVEDVARNPIDYAQAQKLYKALSKANIADSYPQVMKGERVYIITLFDTIRKDGLNSVFGGDLGKQSMSLRLRGTLLGRPLLYADELACLKNINEGIKNAKTPYCQYKSLASSSTQDTLRPGSLANTFTPAYDRMRATVDKADTDIRGTQLFIALQAYKTKFGTYPPTLSQLRAKIPWGLNLEDQFSGKEFVYRLQGSGFLLYSIGTDLKDDGGIDWRDPKIARTAIQGDMVWKADR